MTAGERSRGFTLIELVVVLAIVGLLLSIAAPRYLGSVANGKRTVQRQNVAVLRDAIDKFHGDLGQYPDTLQELVDRRYLRSIPLDPVTERDDWRAITPPNSDRGVYDVAPPLSGDEALK